MARGWAMQLLSLDLATKLGWAYGNTEAGDPVSGSFQLPKTGNELGPFLAAYGRWLQPMVQNHGIELIVMEEPIMPNGMTQMATLLKLYNLVGTTERGAYHWGVPVRQVPAGSWKKAFCGKGNFGKKTSPYPPIVRCHELGWDHVNDDNEADALGLWVYSAGAVTPGAGTRFDPLFRVDQSTFKAA